jgi:hypothetical protein
MAVRRTDLVGKRAASAVTPAAAAAPTGLTPANLASAYKLTRTGGAGVTVAIVEAYHDPTAAADLAVYRSYFGLPACTAASGCFRQVNQNGATSPMPSVNTGWAGEEALDVDMVSAICPLCKILVVEASTSDSPNLYAAEDMAARLANVISNSWGGPEYSGQTVDDAHFNHPGKVITVSTGDNGPGTTFPAASPYVTAVGGTHLVTATNTRGWTETPWSGSSYGCSTFEPRPAWQTVVNTGCTRRAETDVAADGDPATGVSVYQTTGVSGWSTYGGTSVASPIIAAIYASAGTPPAGSYPASFPYQSTGSLFDVVSGTKTAVGWDAPTGEGTPNGTAAFAAPATFSSGFETTDPTLTWTNTVNDGLLANVGPLCCGATGPEAGIRTGEKSHTGTSAVMYSGMAKGGTSVYAYMKIYDLSANPVPVGTMKTLSYWIFPQSSATTSTVSAGSINSECVAIDLIFTDGSTLRDSGAVDQNGNRAHPAYQCGHLTLDTWNLVTVNLATKSAGKQISRIMIGFDHPSATGGYRGYIDDLTIS